MEGFIFRGKCAGFSERKNGDYTNYSLGFLVQQQDQYGNVNTVTTDVEVNSNAASNIGNAAREFTGKTCEVQVEARAMNGKTGPWLKMSVARDAVLTPIQNK